MKTSRGSLDDISMAGGSGAGVEALAFLQEDIGSCSTRSFSQRKQAFFEDWEGDAAGVRKSGRRSEVDSHSSLGQSFLKKECSGPLVQANPERRLKVVPDVG